MEPSVCVTLVKYKQGKKRPWAVEAAQVSGTKTFVWRGQIRIYQAGRLRWSVEDETGEAKRTGWSLRDFTKSTRCTQLVLATADWCQRRGQILGPSMGARFHVSYPPLNNLLHADDDGCLPWQPLLCAKTEMGRELPAPQFSVNIAECLVI